MDDAHTQPRTFTLPERIRIARAFKDFGLGHVRLPGITTTGQPCLGYQHGCTCGCKAKPDEARTQPAQPWQPRPARNAA